MNMLVLECHETVRMWLEDEFPLGSLNFAFAGKTYEFVEESHFFEWLFDATGSVVGVELHNPPNQAVFPRLAAGAIDCADPPYPRIWFTPVREGKGRCLQDWEDFHYQADDGSLLIALGTNMLSPHEKETLKLSLESEKERNR